jgi:hypothetical protein
MTWIRRKCRETTRSNKVNKRKHHKQHGQDLQLSKTRFPPGAAHGNQHKKHLQQQQQQQQQHLSQSSI